MKYEKVIMAIAVLSFVFSAGISSIQTRAMRDLEDRQEDDQKIELIMESIENNSYETWQKLVNPNSKIAKIIGPEEFNKFVKTRTLARQTKYKEAIDTYEKLKISLGLDNDDVDRIVGMIGEKQFI